MKIERLSENKIRCTLTKEDLVERNLKVSDLAYGSEKSKQLFREMMEMAEMEVGFTGEEVPIIVEAVPTRAGSLVLIITKVENPEELDTRFSNFTPAGAREEAAEEIENSAADFSSETLENIIKPEEGIGKALMDIFGDEGVVERLKEIDKRVKSTKVNKFDKKAFYFKTMDDAAKFSSVVVASNAMDSDFYKAEDGDGYYLVLSPRGIDQQAFVSVCNSACEYGRPVKGVSAEYFVEYCKRIIKGEAIYRLAIMLTSNK